MARHLVEKDVQTGLYVNTRLADSQKPACVAAGTGAMHLALMLEALAKTTADADSAFVDFFESRRGDLGFGGTLVFVVGEVSPAMDLMMIDLIGTGRRIVGLKVGTGSQETHAPGAHWQTIRETVSS